MASENHAQGYRRGPLRHVFPSPSRPIGWRRAAKTDGGITAVPVQFEFKGPWRGVCAFFAELQAPDRFLVVQQSRMRVDPSDATQMLCDCTVAKWFAAR